jgi:UDP-N-acetylglucosamine 2-epimerase (non-hydrolysing)
MRIAVCFGTRPEIIKLAMLSQKLRKYHDVSNIFTGQHSSLFDDVKHLIDVIDFSISIPKDQNVISLYSILTEKLGEIFLREKFDLVIVQGDTASAYAASLAAFLCNIKVGHVEAGLRTHNLFSPFPEEFNRQMISKIAEYNWCPSAIAYKNLQDEHINGKILLTGNTIVDFVQSFCNKIPISETNDIIVTLHRRENTNVFENVLNQLNSVAEAHPYLNFIFPVHPNPIIREKVKILAARNIFVQSPMKYEDFLARLSSCRGIISDSGGIQEEAVCLRKKMLVCRNTTERMEAVNCGISRLVYDNITDNFGWLLEPILHKYINPYGEGNACEKIIETII